MKLKFWKKDRTNEFTYNELHLIKFAKYHYNIPIYLRYSAFMNMYAYNLSTDVDKLEDSNYFDLNSGVVINYLMKLIIKINNNELNETLLTTYIYKVFNMDNQFIGSINYLLAVIATMPLVDIKLPTENSSKIQKILNK